LKKILSLLEVPVLIAAGDLVWTESVAAILSVFGSIQWFLVS
jgi:hypothetical protein